MWRTIYHEFLRWAKVSEPEATACNQTEITVETNRVWIIRKLRATRGWCAECGREVDMVGPQDAEALLGKTQPATVQPMLPGCGDSRGWHWSEDSNGSPLVCLESLLRGRSGH